MASVRGNRVISVRVPWCMRQSRGIQEAGQERFQNRFREVTTQDLQRWVGASTVTDSHLLLITPTYHLRASACQFAR
jgi:hypothetical protein